MIKHINIWLSFGVIALLLVVFKVVRNMSHSKLIYTRLIKAGLPAKLALLIVAQSKHETAMKGVPFMSRQFLVNNNGFGYGKVAGNSLQIPGGGGSHPEDGGVYAKYATFANSIDDVAGWYKRRKNTFFAITEISAFASALKANSFFTAPTTQYVSGLKNFYTTNIT